MVVRSNTNNGSTGGDPYFSYVNKEFLYGSGAGLIETIILYPQNKLIFRQALHGVKVKEAILQLKTEGISLLYRGLLPPLLMRTSTRALMFGMNDTFQKVLGCSTGSDNKQWTFCHASAAFLAGTTEAILCPLERIQVLLQASAYHKNFKNTQHAFNSLKVYGFKEYYRGLSVIIFRNGFSNALFFGLRSPLKEFLINPETKQKSALLNTGADFASGALLGTSISTIFFPINVIKHRMQSVIGVPNLNVLQVAKLVWIERDRSIKQCFRGVYLNYTRSLFGWGITNSMYEVLHRFFDNP
uniref:Solute carrier family 25 member 51 n=1 Tax=Rhabditophanes sp. KR3021 TaxID=114890 RepID=A0AC35TPP5_9BILA